MELKTENISDLTSVTDSGSGQSCRDRSDESRGRNQSEGGEFCLQAGSSLLPVSASMFVCPASSDPSRLVCAVRCDRRPDGCLEDVDEEDCLAAAGESLVVVAVVVPCLLLTLLVMETVYRAGSSYDQVDEREEREEREERLLEEGGGAVGRQLAEFSRIILDPNNWDLGLRDQTNILKPSYHEGGFDVEQLETLRQLYRAIRGSSMTDALQYLTFTIQQDQRLEDYLTGDALKHYAHCLIYRVLEREYLQTQGYSQPTDLDVSIMKELNTRQSNQFYGQVFPYFDPIGAVKKSLGTEKKMRKLDEFVKKIPRGPEIQNAVLVSLAILGWYVDFVKDILIATDLTDLYQSFWDFKSQLVLLLWITPFLAQTIIGCYLTIKFWKKPSHIFGAGVELRFSSRQKMLARALFLCLAPVAPAVLIYINKRRERKLIENTKKLAQLDETKIAQRLGLFQERQDLLTDQDELEVLLTVTYQLETVLENSPQLLVQLLILLMNSTLLPLPSVTGIQAVFDGHISGNFLSSAVFYVSISLSLQSICTGHLTSYIVKKKNHLPDLGKLLTFLLFFLGCTARILAIVFFFTPALGLFNMMLPFSLDDMMSYSPQVQDQLGRETLAEMADMSWYFLLSFSPSSCLFVFSFTLLIHLVVMAALRGNLAI